MVCDTCGQEHLTVHGNPACPGHITNGERKGEHCAHEAGFGTEHLGIGQCKFHGGSTPNANKHANEIILDREARKLLGVEGFEPITDPFTALAELAGETVKLKDVLLRKVEELTDLRTTLVGDKSMTEQIDVVFAAYERSLDRCEKILGSMARLDLESRIARLHTRINNDTAAVIMKSMEGALDEANLSGAVREVIRAGFATRLQSGFGPHSDTDIAAIGATSEMVEVSTT